MGKLGRIMKAVVALVSSGGAAALMIEFGVPVEAIAPIVAALTSFLVWVVPNKAPKAKAA